MKHIGIICEFNPIHRGHARLISRAREEGLVVCLMSGNFTQRGEAAVLPPVPRATMAIAAGADLVLELPFPYACASAAYFAGAGVEILSRLGVDTLAFGSESGDLSRLSVLAEKEETQTPARGATGTAEAYFAGLGESLFPNDILALAYLRAARGRLDFLALKREGSAYDERELPGEGIFPSAAALRRALAAGADVSAYLPEGALPVFRQAAEATGFSDTAALGTALLARLRAPEREGPPAAECGGGFLAHLRRAAAEATDYESLCRNAATKRYTNARVRRGLLYLLSGVVPEDLRARPAYVRLLAAGPRGMVFLRESTHMRDIPVVTKPRDAAALGKAAVRQRELARIADGLFALCFPHPIPPRDLQTAKPYLAAIKR